MAVSIRRHDTEMLADALFANLPVRHHAPKDVFLRGRTNLASRVSTRSIVSSGFVFSEKKGKSESESEREGIFKFSKHPVAD